MTRRGEKRGHGGAGSGWLRAETVASGAATRPIAMLGLAGVALGVVQAWSLAQLVGPLLAGAAVQAPVLWGAVFALAALARAGLGVVADGRAFAAGAAARRRLRTGFLIGALARGPHAGAPPGEAAAVAIDRVDALDAYFSRWLPIAVLAWAGPLLVTVALLPVDWGAALVVAGACALVPVGMAMAGLGAAAASRAQFDAMARLQARFLDQVRGIATIVMAGRSEDAALRLERDAHELSRRTMRVLRVAFLSSAVLDAAAAAALVVLAVRAGLAAQAGRLDPVAATFGLVLVAEAFAPLRTFAAAYQDQIQARISAEALALPAPEAVQVPPHAVRTVAASGVTVAFENVRFAWDESRGPALDGLSFRVPPGETVVLVGPSGAGKSTVIELLLGFVRPQAGRITINGADIASITPAALSRMTAWIGQRPALFAGTIRENIRFGREDASDEDVAAAAAAAGLDQVAALLPEGLGTVVGEGGYGLSGGQAQRVAIARAYIRQAPLLLLDEPTAHLDPATEADVLDSLRRIALGRTVLLATHSSAAMAFGGRRIVLEAGRVAHVQGAA